ncbi:Immunoglobulin I-set domain-containing protein [Roseateles sp. YR242]|nr:Immunoglobulin I-set domain-containing protein [Roseateles sp. YR242]
MMQNLGARSFAFCAALTFSLGLTVPLAGCGGGSSSSDSSAEATTSSAPTVTTQPVSQSVIVGASASFSVAASGSGTLAYQWRKAGSAISGATSASYAISAVATGDAGSYDVVVSNSIGSTTSSTATLTVTTAAGVTAPAITTPPTSQAVATGGSITLTVVASGSTPLTYQWAKDGTAISGATSDSYTISAATSSDAGSYTVTVSNAAGTATSSEATITVSTSSGSSALAATVTTAAQSFYGTLSSSQQSSVQLSWSLDTARKWSNLPAAMVARNGVALSSLSTAQKTAANTMIAAALSTSGNTLWQGLLAADDYLYAIGGGSSYGSGNYYIAFIGTPSATSFWVLQLTGHHLTYNIAFNGTTKGPTPLFLGIEPRTSFTVNGATYDPMSAQRTSVSDLATALKSYSAAALSGTYADLLFGANGSGNIDGTYPKSYPSGTSGRGVLYSALSTADQAKVKAVIQAYIGTQATEYADELSAAYLSDTALAQTYVAYAGAGDVATSGSYVRVDGPRVWIEFSVQGGVIVRNDTHYHTIFRDKTGDYGGKCCS